MAKTKNISTGKIALEDMPDALTEILTDFQRSSFDVRQNAVQAGAEVFKSAVEQATPRDTNGGLLGNQNKIQRSPIRRQHKDGKRRR